MSTLVLTLSACATAAADDPADTTPPAATATNATPETPDCAEAAADLVAYEPGSSYVTVWGSTPEDPADLEPEILAHPATVVVDTVTMTIVDSIDRDANGVAYTTETPPCPVPVNPSWPAESALVLDAYTFEILETFPSLNTPEDEDVATTTSLTSDALTTGTLLEGAAAEPYATLVADDLGAELGLEFAAAVRVMDTVVGGAYESPSGVGFTFRTNRGIDITPGQPAGSPTTSLEVPGAEGRTYSGPEWGLTAEAWTTDRSCVVAVLAYPVTTDVPDWPPGYGEYLSTIVLPRLLATC
ncbi:hypothetical protein EXU48_01835 [Occultella glacieicola]|uniref:Uncharacterized protein n=1 Tax=Occultella glacieicola TaxID=2518684 RepID=A0ABY2E8Y3_9MICO|nr:hypothetical protein [Occultella glacieicola]TDE98958.1 hypothetical protein EXU48_01835 [Occultella glacieicola]